MKELQLVEDGKILLDSDYPIKFVRPEPLLTLEVKMTSRGSHIHQAYFEQQILDMQKEGDLPKGLFTFNAYAVVGRKPIDETETVQRSWGPTDYNNVELCTVELYFLGEE